MELCKKKKTTQFIFSFELLLYTKILLRGKAVEKNPLLATPSLCSLQTIP